MGVEASGLDDLEQLVADGKISADADVTEIAAYLAGNSPASDKGAAADPTDKGAEAEGKQTAKADGDGTADPAASGDKNGGDTTDPAQADEPTGPIVTESGQKIPFGVLSGTRKQLAKAQENLRLSAEREEQDRVRIAQLEAELANVRKAAPTQQQTQAAQAIADRAGITDAQGRAVDVTTIDVAALRGEFPDAVVNVLEAFQQTVLAHQATISELRSRDAVRTNQETLTQEEQLQADIDAVPFIARLQADESPHLWNAAVALDKSLSNDPAWQGKPRIEVFREIARQMGAPDDEIQAPDAAAASQAPVKPNKQAPTPAQVQQQVTGALRRAAARSAPTSLSDLPAGSPAAQSEADNLAGMDVTELAAKFAAMTPSQQEAYLAKHG